MKAEKSLPQREVISLPMTPPEQQKRAAAVLLTHTIQDLELRLRSETSSLLLCLLQTLIVLRSPLLLNMPGSLSLSNIHCQSLLAPTVRELPMLEGGANGTEDEASFVTKRIRLLSASAM